MIKLEERLEKEFKIMPNKFVKINSDYYIGGKNDLFVDKTLKQIQYMIFCLCLCDNRIQVAREIDNCYMPDFVFLEINREDYKVFRFLYGKHIKEFVNMDKNIDIKTEDNEQLFFSIVQDDNIYISINTKIIKYSTESTYTNVWVGDALLTKKKPSLYIKMKAYSFLDIQNYVEEIGYISEKSKIKIMFKKEEFLGWANCGHRFKQFIVDSMKSINTENEYELEGDFLVRDTSIVISFTELSIANHIKKNGAIAYSKYVGTTKKRNLGGTW